MMPVASLSCSCSLSSASWFSVVQEEQKTVGRPAAASSCRRRALADRHHLRLHRLHLRHGGVGLVGEREQHRNHYLSNQKRSLFVHSLWRSPFRKKLVQVAHRL